MYVCVRKLEGRVHETVCFHSLSKKDTPRVCVKSENSPYNFIHGVSRSSTSRGTPSRAYLPPLGQALPLARKEPPVLLRQLREHLLLEGEHLLLEGRLPGGE